MRIAFLGLGKMGSAIARLLVAKGHDVSVWNRTRSHAQAIAGATAASEVRDARVVLTMVNDDAALEGVLFEGGVLDAMQPGAAHMFMSTVSVAPAERLEREHAARGQGYVGCPVFGRPAVPAEGKLRLAIAGSDALRCELSPVLDTFSRGLSVVGDRPRKAHALKPGGNFPITAMIVSLSEALAFAEAQGIAPELFLETVNNDPFQSPFYAAYGKVMLHLPEQAAATVAIGARDMRLFREASDTPTPLADLFAGQLATATAQRLAGDDRAAGYPVPVRERAWQSLKEQA